MIRDAGGVARSLSPLDLSDPQEATRWVNFAVSTFGAVDILYNNAASFRHGTLATLTDQDWAYSFANEVMTVITPTRAAVPYFQQCGGGTVLNIASVAGSIGGGSPGNLPGTLAHSVFKAAVIRLTRCLAVELASINVRVNSISPGPIETAALSAQLSPGADPRLRERYIKSGLVGRIGVPHDVVAAALFLCSDEAAFITGIDLAVDGGFSASGGVGRADPDLADVLRAARASITGPTP
jgi:NAD(P)-dependent dehydrogenase (short-subunit alcohol dehydrogenase family)